MLKYSADDEDFRYDSAHEAIESMGDPQVGDTYYSCEAVPVTAERIISTWAIEGLLEKLDECLYDEVHCEDSNPFSEVQSENIAELRVMVVEWTKKYTDVETYWYFTTKSTKHFVTEEDLKELE